MREKNKKLAKMLFEHHPGIDTPEVAEELVDSFFDVTRKFLLQEGELTMEGIGKLKIKVFAGSEAKRDARTDIVHKIPPRKVLKVIPSDNFKKLINIGRRPSEVVG